MKLSKEILKNLINEVLQEGIMQQMEAEKILRDEFFRVKELKSQGKATEEELVKAYEDMKNLDKSQFYTGEELASFESEKMQRDIDRETSIDQEIEDERLASQRLDRDRMDYLRTAKAVQGGKFQTPGPDGQINVRGIGATIGDEGPELEAVMNEVRLEPDYSDFASDDQITKIRSLLDSGDPESINMAKTLLDALGTNPSYFDDYMRNQEVGDVEKLANKHGVHGTSMSPDWDSRKKALADWTRGLNKFADREQGRGRNPADADKEFIGRYDSVADTYKPKGLSESSNLKGKKK